MSAREVVLNGKPSIRSGLQRDKPTPQERLLRQEINQLLKNLPKTQEVISKLWATALDRTKTRISNKIEELQTAIDKKEAINKAKNVQSYDDADLDKLKEQLKTTTYYVGKIKNYKVISCCTDFAVNELAYFSLKKFNADIAFIVIPSTNRVSIRKNKNTCELDLSKLAELLCDGGGHAYASGGKLTDKFLNFTKTLINV